jgi:hypothetical protein
MNTRRAFRGRIPHGTEHDASTIEQITGPAARRLRVGSTSLTSSGQPPVTTSAIRPRPVLERPPTTCCAFRPVLTMVRRRTGKVRSAKVLMMFPAAAWLLVPSTTLGGP